jgi:hypothetical protein
MSELQIDLTPEILDEAVTVVRTKRTFEPPPEGWQPFVLDSIEPTVSKGKGAYQFRVRLVWLEDEDDIASADSTKSTMFWAQLPIRNPATGYEPPPGKGLYFMKRKLRYFFAALGYEFGNYPQWDGDAREWSFDGEAIDNSEADTIVADYMRKVLTTAVGLYNDAAERDTLVSDQRLIWCKIEHKENTYTNKDGEEITKMQADVQQTRVSKPENA